MNDIQHILDAESRRFVEPAFDRRSRRPLNRGRRRRWPGTHDRRQPFGKAIGSGYRYLPITEFKVRVTVDEPGENAIVSQIHGAPDRIVVRIDTNSHLAFGERRTTACPNPSRSD